MAMVSSDRSSRSSQQNHRPTQPPPTRSTNPRKVKRSAPGLTCICGCLHHTGDVIFNFGLVGWHPSQGDGRTGVKASTSLQPPGSTACQPLGRMYCWIRPWPKLWRGTVGGLEGRRVEGSEGRAGCKGFVRLAVIDDGSARQQSREQRAEPIAPSPPFLLPTTTIAA